MRKRIERLAVALAFFALNSSTPAKLAIIDVPAGGSLAAAVEQSRNMHRNGNDKVRILLHGGTYALERPLVLTGKDSGLSLEAAHHETPVISGQTVIHGWTTTRANPNVWQTTIAAVQSGNWIFHELFVNGQRKARTRLPEIGFFEAAGAGFTNNPTELQFHSGDVKPEWAREGTVELVLYEGWAQTRNQIREVNTASNLMSLAGDVVPNLMEPHPRFYIENPPLPLQPGQWHLDLHNGVLTYWPEAGEDVPRALITAPHLYDLIQIEGTAEQPAHDIALRGLTFADTDWRLDGGSDFDTQAAVEVPGAVQARFARHSIFERCKFERLGGYGLELDRGCEYDQIVGNEMHDLGAGGIRVGERALSAAVADPCGNHVITDNHIHHIGLVNAPGVGIFVLLSAENLIAHNEVDHTFYTAISVGWSWGYDPNPCRKNVVEYNNLHDIGQGRLSDMGGVYTLGVQPGTIVRNNLIHDVNVFGYGGWGLYTDEGSSGIVLENNVVYRCQSAGFHQHYGEGNIIRNNIFAFNREAQLARTRLQSHLSFTFTNNIVYFDTGYLLSGRWGNDLSMDHNIYFDTRATPAENNTRKMIRSWQERGHDQHSLIVDPLFVAPRQANFRLKANSPALRFGFKQIDLSGVGVRSKYRTHP